MREVHACRACLSDDLDMVLSIGTQSLSAFVLPNQVPRRGPLELLLCHNCGLVQLGHIYPGDWLYTWYGYRSGTNGMMVTALGSLADSVASLAPLEHGDSVLDIGSNDGTLLRHFTVPKLRRIGFDPAKNLGPIAKEGLDLFVNDYFTAEAMAPYVEQHGHMKAVTAAAVFYLLEEPVKFLEDVRTVLDPDGLLVIQMNYLPTMLARNGYDNIVHEHQTYYSLSSLIDTLRRGGFHALDVSTNEVNGGSFRVWCAPTGSTRTIPGGAERLGAMLAREAGMNLESKATYGAFGKRLRRLRDDLRSVIEHVVSQGKRVYVYGASTRGLAIMEYCQLDHDLITGAAERNTDKWGRSYGSTNIPCVSEEDARVMADYFLVLPHHFLPNFVEREADWLKRGGIFIVPLPELRLVGSGGAVIEHAKERAAVD